MTPPPARSAPGWQGISAGLAVQGRNLGQAGGGAGGRHGLPATVLRPARQGQDPLRIRQGRHRWRIPLGLLDRLIETAMRCPTAMIEIAGHTDGDGDDGLQPGAVGKARPGGGRLSGQGGACRPTASRRSAMAATQPVARQRQRRRQGAEPPHRFHGEVTHDDLATFSWGWLLGAALLGLAMGWISVVQRGQGVSKSCGRWARRARRRCWSALALARLVPGRPGYWLDLGLVMLALYLAAARWVRGCATGWCRAVSPQADPS